MGVYPSSLVQTLRPSHTTGIALPLQENGWWWMSILENDKIGGHGTGGVVRLSPVTQQQMRVFRGRTLDATEDVPASRRQC